MAETLPIEPLEELAFRLSPFEQRFEGGKADGTFNDRVFAEMIGVAYRTLKRWRANGGTLTWDAADKAAIRLGDHPHRVWGVEWEMLDPEAWGLVVSNEAAETAEAVIG